MNEQFNREQELNLRARGLGYLLRKSWTDGSVCRDGTYLGESPSDRGGWMIVDAATNVPITGIRYERTLEDIEAFVDVRT
jgi:hypothetical protein